MVKAVKSLGGLVHFTGGLLRIESSVSNSKLPHRIVGVAYKIVGATSFNPSPALSNSRRSRRKAQAGSRS